MTVTSLIVFTPFIDVCPSLPCIDGLPRASGFQSGHNVPQQIMHARRQIRALLQVREGVETKRLTVFRFGERPLLSHRETGASHGFRATTTFFVSVFASHDWVAADACSGSPL